MDYRLKYKIDNMINNYRRCEEELKYDGLYMNHFAALIFTNSDKEINSKKIRHIRKYIKENTIWFSSFRGDTLYMLSILLSIEENWEIRFKRILTWEERLKEEGFVESSYLSIGIWVLTEYFNDNEIEKASKKMYEIYSLIKKKYKNVTSVDDYVLCALLVVIDMNSDIYINVIDSSFNRVTSEGLTTNNGAQTLANILCIDFINWKVNLQKSIDILKNVEKMGGKVQPQHTAIVGLGAVVSDNINIFIKEVKKINSYLCEYPEYSFFMDRSFRLILSMAISIFYHIKGNKFINSIIALTINYTLLNQQQGLISSIN
ncbi:hypothetical protein CPJCM30710_07840 [Clostridium polyendosporum]|uniref:DUF4003 domain-containing protein n=1 Tax=Clostridium polyendosporum TaxID=69208 RepID=A0A919S021_9CLOT|nr:DUF4003 family protein [Clostridium polyendosporum]GIM28118.1 hypothetical protein CPJCM30710_07840 [Clostridium polyendosporum]